MSKCPSPAPCAILFPAEGNLGHLESRRENANSPASVGKIFLLTSLKLKRPCQGTVSFPRLFRLAERCDELKKRGARGPRRIIQPRSGAPALSYEFHCRRGIQRFRFRLQRAPHFPRREQWSRARLSGASHSRCLRRGGWRGRRLEQTSGRKLKRRCDPDERGL